LWGYGELIPIADSEQFKLPIELPEGYNYRFERFYSIDSAQIKFSAEFYVNVVCEVKAIDGLRNSNKFQGYLLTCPKAANALQYVGKGTYRNKSWCANMLVSFHHSMGRRISMVKRRD
jgi:hypothetical protein